MTAQLKDPLIWIDYETTGPDVHKDALVEVGVVIIDADPKIVDKGTDVLIKPLVVALENMNDLVRDIHTTSGFLDEPEDGLSLEKATGQVLDYIRRFASEQGKALLAGNSVGTDKMLLEAHMPSVIDHLHYRIVDASSVKRLAERQHRRAFENAPVKHGGHRVLTGILESTQELEYYRRVFFPVEPVIRVQMKAAFKDAPALRISMIDEDEQPCVDQDEGPRLCYPSSLCVPVFVVSASSSPPRPHLVSLFSFTVQGPLVLDPQGEVRATACVSRLVGFEFTQTRRQGIGMER